ncbi:MAG: EamA family transporter [Acidimicrobiaceae bacterium]|nr:EamA family transporter [Acidimicrobiaceae bacterium]
MNRGAPELLFMCGAVSQYLGAVVAVGLFEELSPGATGWLRVLGAAAIIVVLRRTWRRRFDRSTLFDAAKFGVALAAMNLAFYLAIDELPLGNAVAIEFLGPLAVAAFGTRTLRAGGALMLAVVGVVILAGVEAEGTVRGVSFALLAAVFWAMYIVLGHRVARSPAAIDGLGLGMLVGAIAISPFGVPDVTAALGTPWLLALGLATGLLSNVVPYGIDQLVMQQVDQRRFALLQALLPVTATLIGLIFLVQVPSLRDLTGITLVIVSIALSRS